MLTTPVAHSLCCTLPLNTCPNHTARTILLPHTTQHINMALLSKQNIMAKPAMRSAAMPRISPAIRRNVAAASAAPELLVDTKTAVHVLSGETFESFVASHDTVLVDYYTEWCGPCKMIAPYFEEMAQQIPQIKFAKLNCTSDNAAKKIAMSQSVKALPTFHMFRGGEKVASFVGGKPQQLRKFIDEYLATR